MTMAEVNESPGVMVGVTAPDTRAIAIIRRAKVFLIVVMVWLRGSETWTGLVKIAALEPSSSAATVSAGWTENSPSPSTGRNSESRSNGFPSTFTSVSR